MNQANGKLRHTTWLQREAAHCSSAGIPSGKAWARPLRKFKRMWAAGYNVAAAA